MRKNSDSDKPDNIMQAIEHHIQEMGSNSHRAENIRKLIKHNTLSLRYIYLLILNGKL